MRIPIILAGLILSVCYSCSPRVTQNHAIVRDSLAVKTEIRDRVIQRVDTVRDVQNNTIVIRGDTMIVYRDRVRDRFSRKTDTLLVQRTDTCYLTKTQKVLETRTVARTRWWQWLLMLAGGVLTAFGAFKVLRKLKK